MERRNAGVTADPLFVGVTRPPMRFGVTYAALLLPSNMISEAGLSFLGVGVRPPASSWGQMLSTATTWFQADPTYVLVPGLLLLVNVLAFTVLADGLRTALDPKAPSLRGGRR